MKRESLLYGIIGLLAGVIITVLTVNLVANNNNKSMMHMMGMHSKHLQENCEMSMAGMVSELENKKGDDFDKIFITRMIEHHQGAIVMAMLAKQNAKHDEIKKLAEDINTSQTKEINQMKAWQKAWGYLAGTDEDNMHMMAH